MSVEALAIVLNHSQASGTAKLILVGIANHDGDGGAWPSLATLARYGSCSIRNAQRALGKLEELGEVKRHINAGGNHLTVDHMRPNLYQITLRCPYACDGSKNHRDRTRVTFDVPIDPLTPASPPDASVTPPPDASVTRTIPRTIHRDPETKSGNWAVERCPAALRGTDHEVGRYGHCINCHERPIT